MQWLHTAKYYSIKIFTPVVSTNKLSSAATKLRSGAALKYSSERASLKSSPPAPLGLIERKPVFFPRLCYLFFVISSPTGERAHHQSGSVAEREISLSSWRRRQVQLQFGQVETICPTQLVHQRRAREYYNPEQPSESCTAAVNVFSELSET